MVPAAAGGEQPRHPRQEQNGAGAAAAAAAGSRADEHGSEAARLATAEVEFKSAVQREQAALMASGISRIETLIGAVHVDPKGPITGTGLEVQNLMNC
ncbi:hypothetical protein Esi_0106_0063 [Ectocarpus siliculosus]|uniref:Uncharacterized protein n=1 Tax=Ectocarpus siliculosus TaxID=2880 RepID=D7FH96_ECTSI|nr:hypothetical protein Esi_0106_0063 [Ectocarpus siliculosus]|eukprot:CBJ28467.1 hypothetical protein Esi_0106_0063 [Ectocarpus siliculosus]